MTAAPRLLSPTLLAALCLASSGKTALADDAPPGVHTTRAEARALPLPKGDDVFHFVIYGDRTGGPAEGIKVLADAVVDTNLLDPDLVMTVGDLVNGYNETPQWLEQMEEFRATMGELRMPWFPVAGNHDVYWRGKGERPEKEHEPEYEKHFGPLWYWFAHKNCGFLALYTDEGSAGKAKTFSEPHGTQMSEEQLGFLRGALAEMKGLDQVFVFLHHPRWMPQYRGTNWPEVHKLLVEAGNVTAVFAGHIHRLHYGGVQDGIEYFALATTGGSMPGDYPDIGYVHHLNVVSVRDSGISMTVLPVGAAIDPKDYTLPRQMEIDRLRSLPVRIESGPLELAADGAGAGFLTARIENPSESWPIEVTLRPDPAAGWRFLPDHRHVTVAPGQSALAEIAYAKMDTGFALGSAPPRAALEVDFLDGGNRITLPVQGLDLPISLRGAVPGDFFSAEKPDRHLALPKDRSAVRVDSSKFALPADSPITVEAWVKADRAAKTSAVAAKTEQSEFAIFCDDGKARFEVFVGGAYRGAGDPEPLPAGQWTHVAGVYDGKEVRLYRDGKLAGSREASGPRRTNGLPLFIGADPDGAGEPTRSFPGAINEFRLSKSARYTGDFDPAKRHEPDADTVLLFHFDDTLGDFHPDHSGADAHGVAVHGAALAK